MSRLSKTFFSITCLVSIFFITACGQDVCVSGVGKCEVPESARVKQPQSGSTTGPSSISPLKGGIQSDHLSVNRGEQITIVGMGGTKPYKFAVSSASGTGSIGENDGVFTAPSASAKAKVKITDASNTSIEIQIDIP